MNEEIINTKNTLIAKFMGYELDEDGNFLMGCNLPQFRGSDHGEWCGTKSIEYDFTKPEDVKKVQEVGSFYWEISPDHLCYESSWDWIMPVWFKILDINVPGEIEISDTNIGHKSVSIRGYIWGGLGIGWISRFFYHDCIEYDDGTLECTSVIEALYKTIVEFIEWYKIYYTK